MKRKIKGGSAQRPARKVREIRYEDVSFVRHILFVALLTLLVTLVVEGFNQKSPGKLFCYMGQRPLNFLLNWLLIFATFSFAELFRRRRAVICTLTIVWIVLGFANCMVARDRTLPMLLADILQLRETIGLATLYLTTPALIGVIVGGCLIIVCFVLLFTRAKRCRRVLWLRSGLYVFLVMLTAAFVSLLTVQCGWISVDYIIRDRVAGFQDYGFTTSFLFTFGGSGIEEPKTYSNRAVGDIMQGISEPQATAATTSESDFGEDADLAHPNIIFLQLESFFDVDELIGAEFSEDPLPNFHTLLESCPNGRLYVPTIGGGTSNVEFEVLSGMDIDFFSAGEAPYSTIITETTCESMATILGQQGYTSTALHNNTGTFYSRNEIYANLGFNRFDSIEYMRYPVYTATGWARDSVLIGEILEAMDSTEGRDFLFPITVESHGKYEDEYIPGEGDVTVLSAPEEIHYEAFCNYINLLHSVDETLGELLEQLSACDEPVLVVIYGDHLPGLGLTADMLETGDLYASKYILWSNYGGEFEAADMEAYRLGSDVLRQIGISDGVLTRFHQSYDPGECGEAYLEELRLLEYDLLYGDQRAYGESGAPEKTRLQMGLVPVTIRSADIEYGRLMLTGENYTEYSRVVCGEQVLDTVFVDDRHIAVSAEDLPAYIDDAGVCVAQINSDGKELSRTEVCKVTRAGG